MLPERLSTDLTSLNPDAGSAGRGRRDGRRARTARVSRVRHLSRAWSATTPSSPTTRVAAWLDGHAPAPAPIAARRRAGRESAHAGPGRAGACGSAAACTARSASRPSRREPVFDGDDLRELDVERKNRAKELIEDFMIAANGVTARFLAREAASRRSAASCARPKRWDRIVELAGELGDVAARRAGSGGARGVPRCRAGRRSRCASPICRCRHQAAGRRRIRGRSPGRDGARAFRARGEGLHALDRAEPALSRSRHPAAAEGGARRRRLAVQRTRSSKRLATHCTDAGGRRQQGRAAGAQIGGGAAARRRGSASGSTRWSPARRARARGCGCCAPPVEGRVVRGFDGMDVGDGVRVQLVAVDVERGFIDFHGVAGRPDGRRSRAERHAP